MKFRMGSSCVQHKLYLAQKANHRRKVHACIFLIEYISANFPFFQMLENYILKPSLTKKLSCSLLSCFVQFGCMRCKYRQDFSPDSVHLLSALQGMICIKFDRIDLQSLKQGLILFLTYDRYFL